jgi:hypothetical protein
MRATLLGYRAGLERLQEAYPCRAGGAKPRLEEWIGKATYPSLAGRERTKLHENERTEDVEVLQTSFSGAEAASRREGPAAYPF